MRIVFVFGSALPYRISFFSKLSQLFDVDFLLQSVERTTNDEYANFHYQCYRSVNLPFLKRYGSYGYLPPSFPIDLVFKLIGEKAHLIISKGIATFTSYISFLLSRFLRRPFILWDETWYYPRTFARTVAMPFVKSMVRNCEAIVVPGSKSKEFLVSLGANRQKIFVAPNACKMLKKVNPRRVEKFRKQLRIRGRRVVLYFGRLIKRKGCSFLIRAFKELEKEFDDVSLIIAGDGPQRKELQHLCQSLKVGSYHFLGYVKESDKASVYSLADVVVVPSIRTPLIAEIWGIVLNEAMSMGIPVIATDAVGGAYDLIQNGVNGFIVKEKDPYALYEAVKKTFCDFDEAKAIGLKSKRKSEKYSSLQKMVEGFKNAIDYVAKQIT